jgi:hypothetical protein
MDWTNQQWPLDPKARTDFDQSSNTVMFAGLNSTQGAEVCPRFSELSHILPSDSKTASEFHARPWAYNRVRITWTISDET